MRARAALVREQVRHGTVAASAPATVAIPPEMQVALEAGPDALSNVRGPYIRTTLDLLRQTVTAGKR